MNKYLILLVALFSSTAFGHGFVVGNGGTGVTCSENPQQIRLLDFYEAEKFAAVKNRSFQAFPSQNLSKVAATGTTEEAFAAVTMALTLFRKDAITKQAKLNISLVDELLKLNQVIKETVTFNEKYPVISQHDYFRIDIDDECMVVPLAIQDGANLFPDIANILQNADYFRIFNKIVIHPDVWAELSLEEKSGLILHELIVGYFRSPSLKCDLREMDFVRDITAGIASERANRFGFIGCKQTYDNQ